MDNLIMVAYIYRTGTTKIMGDFLPTNMAKIIELFFFSGLSTSFL